MSYLTYLSRILPAYVLRKNSQLTFWHERPQVNLNAFKTSRDEVGEYYMTFYDKANYPGPFDSDGIPLLDYHGRIGKQYNSVAISQYGLGNYNLFKKSDDSRYYEKFKRMADWLVNNLEENKHGVYVWNHKFDWEYFRTLKTPWYSALSQGQGLSLLIRAYVETEKERYLETAQKAFEALIKEVKEGGVLFIDKNGNPWLEEYLVDPPTHILNGFIWALLGIYDYHLLTRIGKVKKLFDDCTKTISHYLPKYDIGFWSLYELTPQRIRSIASPFYHQLHIVQLGIMYRLTGKEIFKDYADNWKRYYSKWYYRCLALSWKSLFKLVYY